MKTQRQNKTRKNIRATTDRIRLSVYRSNTSIYAQLIDDSKRVTLAGISEKVLSDKKGTPLEKAKKLGLEIAKLAQEKKVKEVVFDKGPYKYHGRVKALAEGAREGGLQF